MELRTELRAVGVRWWWTGDSTLTAMPDTVRATAKNWHRPLTADQRVKLEQMRVSVPEVPLSPRLAHEAGVKTASAIPADLIDLESVMLLTSDLSARVGHVICPVSQARTHGKTRTEAPADGAGTPDDATGGEGRKAGAAHAEAAPAPTLDGRGERGALGGEASETVWAAPHAVGAVEVAAHDDAQAGAGRTPGVGLSLLAWPPSSARAAPPRTLAGPVASRAPPSTRSGYP